MKKIKYGIIGAGTMVREHILNISLIDNAEVVALADPHAVSYTHLTLPTTPYV